ncbi:hypothetical protein [Lacicoccus qingdaonensis]|uniref:Uncharacterized protein n=1 Tax=Lacicoccus qingdaonensis TaxID=576118 RepID=A0A1G9AY61_9BACL|nr:hypothetical protein [Salinicoccus qingdaonensis]SDK31565.1 hypothetical protein SAMN05216216_10221 [Salinicoccus qingdaonensis]
MKIKFFRPFFVLGMGFMFLASLFVEIPGMEVAIAVFTALALISYLPYLSRVPLTVVIILNVTAVIFYIIGGSLADVIEGLLMNTAVLMIFIFVPLLAIPITSPRYLKDITGLLKSSFNNTKQSYNALKLGTFSIGSVLNVGTLPILYYLTDTDQFKDHKVMRMAALNRGFALAFAWSPYFISIAVILSYFEVQWLAIAAFGLTMSVISLIGEWFLFNDKKYREMPESPPVYYSRRRIAELGVIMLLMTGLIIILDMFSGFAIVNIIPIVAIVLFIVWSVAIGGVEKVVKGLKSYTQERIPNMGNELLVFISAGVFGTSLLVIGFDTFLINMLEAAGVNHVLLLIPIFAVLIIGLSFFSVHPIITITVAALSVLSMDMDVSEHYYMAIVLLLNWAVTVNLSPFTGINLLMSSLANKSIFTMPKHNALYGLCLWFAGYAIIAFLYFV